VVAGFLSDKPGTTVAVLKEKMKDSLVFKNCRNVDQE
jgi:hypothetical protein